MNQRPDVTQLLISLVMLGIETESIFIFFAVAFALDFATFKRHWKRGLAISLALVLASIPASVMSFYYMDFSHLPGMEGVPPELKPMMPIFVIICAIIFMLVLLPLRAIYYHVAVTEWEKIRPGSAMPALSGTGPIPWKAIGGGAIIGIVLGAF